MSSVSRMVHVASVDRPVLLLSNWVVLEVLWVRPSESDGRSHDALGEETGEGPRTNTNKPADQLGTLEASGRMRKTQQFSRGAVTSVLYSH